ncbi:CHAP domain-containing protein [Kitasatospora sp. NPDC093806]|uniref:CHAP domain-containing protein n=1 Tax=Kitasatospora sp. NPDC093806 TaxID=3155075 RepID=UPI003424D3FE
MSSNAADLIRVARDQVWYHEEHHGGGRRHGIPRRSPAVPGPERSLGEAWCTAFVAWCARESGNAALFPASASCAEDVAWFKERDRFTEYPVIGGQVFFGPGGGSHTGICVAYTGSTVTTVEGGAGGADGVHLKTRDRRSDWVHGYGVPDFAEGVVLADPGWRERPDALYFGQEAAADDRTVGDRPVGCPG